MYDLLEAPARAVISLKDMVSILKPLSHSIKVDALIGGFSVDSRTLERGDVYIAIRGARVDGHDFVEEALSKGAVACLVDSREMVAVVDNVIAVSDTIAALGYLATSHRRAMTAQVIAVTGSVGKTTTKEILYQIVSSSYVARRTLGNFNSTIGMPIQLLRLRPDDEWMIAELGMSTPGEIRTLMKMARPNVGLWTSVQAVHLANFDSVDGIARAKAEMVEGLNPEDTLVYNADDPLVVKHCADFAGRKVSYGVVNPAADVTARIHPFSDWSHVGLTLSLGGRSLRLNVPLVGRYNAYNALAACAAAYAAGFNVQDFSLGMRQIRPSRHRSELMVYGNDVRIVDDTYNANPHAFFQVLRSFAPLSPSTYRWLICGDMLELGPSEEQMHRDLGRVMATYGFDRVTFVGKLSRNSFEGFRDAARPDTQCEYFSDVDDAIAHIQLEVPAHARIWVKASRGIRLELMVEHLLTFLEKQERLEMRNAL